MLGFAMAIMSGLSDCLGQVSCQDKTLSLQSLLIAAHKIRAFHLESASVPGFNVVVLLVPMI